MIGGFSPMAPIVPAARRGNACVTHWTPDGLSLLRARIRGNHLREGHTYAQLWIDGDLWMSDTRDEMVANLPVSRARGRVLIVGLGLGMVVHRVLKNSAVSHCDVIEKDRRVRGLVWDAVTDQRAQCIIADAFKWPLTATRKYDFIWLDIWLDYPSPADIKRVRSLYRPLLKRGGYMGQWEGND